MANAANDQTLTLGHDGWPPVPISASQGVVFINGKRALIVGNRGPDHCKKDNGCHPVIISSGSSKVFIGGVSAARAGDFTSCGDHLSNPGSSVLFGG